MFIPDSLFILLKLPDNMFRAKETTYFRLVATNTVVYTKFDAVNGTSNIGKDYFIYMIHCVQTIFAYELQKSNQRLATIKYLNGNKGIVSIHYHGTFNKETISNKK